MTEPQSLPSDQYSWQPNPWVVSLFLAFIVSMPYWRVKDQAFINYDDNKFVYQNAFVNRGWTVDGLKYAFGVQGVSQWHPLTFISHLIDVELFKMWAGGHKLHNVAYHVLNTVLLYHFVRVMTRQGALAAILALIWGIHPLRVEAVAWVSERKEVLSTFFGLWTLLAYWKWVQTRRWWFYALVLMLFTFALMSKPMWVSMPCIMLLLDYWPLQRIHGLRTRKELKQFSWLLLEKTPMLPLMAVSIYMTMLCQLEARTVGSLTGWPMPFRLANAAIAYWWYIRVTFFPLDLCTLYLLEPQIRSWVAALSVIGLVLTTWLLIKVGKRHPPLIVGWLFFLGTLVPTIGIVQVGGQRWADRYSYLPSIGLLFVLVWGGAILLDRIGLKRFVRTTICFAITAVLLTITALQVNYWFNSEALWLRALDVDDRNVTAHNNIGIFYHARGDDDLADYHYQKAVYFDGENNALVNLSNLSLERGDAVMAQRYAQRMLMTQPRHVGGWMNFGNALMAQGRYQQAHRAFSKALEIDPVDIYGLQSIGNALATMGRIDEAVEYFERARELYPRFYRSHTLLAEAMIIQRRYDAARKLLAEVPPDHPAFSLAQKLITRADHEQTGQLEPTESTMPYRTERPDVELGP